VGHTSKFGGLLRLKASRAQVFQSDLNTSVGATTGGVCGIITEDASSKS
jgi:hypothetical protein